MTPEPCPTCKGRCCRDHYGYRIAHMDTDAEFCEHTCDACYGGTKYTALRQQVAELTALGVSLHKAAAAGRDNERAAVVAWLYRQHYDDTATRIERGEHRRGEGA